MIYGYARVSTDGQSVEAQVRQLAKAGCSKVFREVASGAKTDRTQLRKALDRLEAGDVLMVTRLDVITHPPCAEVGWLIRSWHAAGRA
jgi:DNA invertase Pin-like site-specific DNA recombinase